MWDYFNFKSIWKIIKKQVNEQLENLWPTFIHMRANCSMRSVSESEIILDALCAISFVEISSSFFCNNRFVTYGICIFFNIHTWIVNRVLNIERALTLNGGTARSFLLCFIQRCFKESDVPGVFAACKKKDENDSGAMSNHYWMSCYFY